MVSIKQTHQTAASNNVTLCFLTLSKAYIILHEACKGVLYHRKAMEDLLSEQTLNEWGWFIVYFKSEYN